MKKRCLLSWSGGKDCAWTLHVLRSSAAFAQQYEVVGLLTTFNETTTPPRVAMHAIRVEVLRAQASCVGLPLWQVDLPSPCSNEEYQARMRALMREARARDIAAIAYGDLHLVDVRQYRETNHQGSGIEPLFPIWAGLAPEASRAEKQTAMRALAQTMMGAGARAVLCTVDPKQLDGRYAGQMFTRETLESLPSSVDWCGENGEFHSLALDGPAFARPLAVEVRETVERGGFVFTELKLANASALLQDVDVHVTASSLVKDDWEGAKAHHDVCAR